MYDELINVISDNEGDVDFADYGDGISKEWVEKAEKRLNVVFPKSYIWWLENYSGGEVFGVEIYSVYEMDFDTVVGGDVVYINELVRKNDDSYVNKLIIAEPNDAIFYMDLTQKQEDEYPIYELYSNERYASSFDEFLLKYINSNL
ncbi:MAG: SMI1/KNR4 family protein [Pseudobutyrivibrio ruminis]|uniref:SMI1/KNR4 family protein n=1 Tax=Pseudobutyrivibrio ruminis TaxID=46206 RepID=UPI0026EC8275|nr:SMI1/KNR4 family protein [Pseudobutyrivibrio ruminis]MBE5914910.1 SMI1/KNR4 family protein [Pseudobutyrivibrio ruminis]